MASIVGKDIGLTYKIKGTSSGMRNENQGFDVARLSFHLSSLLLCFSLNSGLRLSYCRLPSPHGVGELIFLSVRKGFWLVLLRTITLASDVRYLISQI